MNILTQPNSTPKSCATCAAPTTGSTQLGEPICTPCAMVAVKAVMQYGGPATNLYPVYKHSTSRTEFLVLAGGAQ